MNGPVPSTVDIKPGLTGSGSCKSHCDVPGISMAPVEGIHSINKKKEREEKKPEIELIE